MGGLLAVDTLIEMAKSRPDKSAPLWPRIVACIAFDTPVCRQSRFPWSSQLDNLLGLFFQYFGLHPFVFKNGATKAAEYLQTAQDIASSLGLLGSFGAKEPPKGGKAPVAAITAPPAPNTTNRASASAWGKWAPTMYGVGGVLLAGAAAGTAYWKKDDIGSGYAWWADHMKYVGNLWDEKALKARVDKAIEIEQELGVIFRTWVIMPHLASAIRLSVFLSFQVLYTHTPNSSDSSIATDVRHPSEGGHYCCEALHPSTK